MKVKEVSNEEIRAFTMPRPQLGASVLWYSAKGREPQIAHVFRVSSRNVHLITATKGVKEAVRHIDDPKLRLNVEQREMGMWDFTDEFKQRQATESLMQSQIDELRRQVSSLITGAPRPKPPLAEKPQGDFETAVSGYTYNELYEKAKKLGISTAKDGPGRVSGAELQQRIEEYEKQNA